jgi:TolB-like protein/Flp pilus assembly protein TadD
MSIVSGLAVATILVFFFDREFGLPVAHEPPVPASEPTAAPPVTDNSIAVLPFMNVDGSDKTRAFSNGLVDDVINRLARVPGLRVSSRGDSFTLEPNSPSDVVRRRLRVAMYIEGSVEIAGDAIRVTVQLINSADGFHIQSRTFNHPLKDFFQIRDEITALTVSSLRVTLPDKVQAKSQFESQAPNFDAYVLYRRGMEELHKPGTIDSLSASIGWMDAALEVDPDFAAAHAGKCRAYVVLYRETDDPAAISDAEQSCANALTRDPNLDIVHGALGELYFRKGMYAEAEAAFLEALRINPQSVAAMVELADTYRLQQRSAEALEMLRGAIGLEPGNWRVYSSLGYFHYRRGEYDEAAAQFEVVLSLDDRNLQVLNSLAASYMMSGNFEAAAPMYARSIDVRPDSTTYSNLALMHYYLRNHDLAITNIEKGIELAPNNHLMWANLGDILTNAKQHDDARIAYLRARELVTTEIRVNPNDPELMMDAAWIEAMLGEEKTAHARIVKSLEIAPDDPYASYIEGLILVRYDNTDAALASLERAVAKGYSTTILKAEPFLSELRDHPRFEKLVNAD